MWLQISVEIMPGKIMSSELTGKGEGRCWGMQSHHTRLLLGTRCFCFCLVAEREIKWEKEEAACEERILPTELLWFFTYEFQNYDPCVDLFWLKR